MLGSHLPSALPSLLLGLVGAARPPQLYDKQHWWGVWARGSMHPLVLGELIEF